MQIRKRQKPKKLKKLKRVKKPEIKENLKESSAQVDLDKDVFITDEDKATRTRLKNKIGAENDPNQKQRLMNYYEYGGRDPLEIPRTKLLELARTVKYDDGTGIEQKYRDRIKNPMTAIRCFCVICQGGSTAGVRKCVSTDCPLWSMRMGRNGLSTRRGMTPGFLKSSVDEDDDDIEMDDDNHDIEQKPLVEI